MNIDFRYLLIFDFYVVLILPIPTNLACKLERRKIRWSNFIVSTLPFWTLTVVCDRVHPMMMITNTVSIAFILHRNCGCCLQYILFFWNLIIIMIIMISMVSVTTTITIDILWWWRCIVRPYFWIHCAERCSSWASPPCHKEDVRILMNDAAAVVS